MNKKVTQRKSLGILQFQNLSVHLLSKQPIKLQVFKRQVKEGRVGHVKFRGYLVGLTNIPCYRKPQKMKLGYTPTPFCS